MGRPDEEYMSSLLSAGSPPSPAATHSGIPCRDCSSFSSLGSIGLVESRACASSMGLHPVPGARRELLVFPAARYAARQKLPVRLAFAWAAFSLRHKGVDNMAPCRRSPGFPRPFDGPPPSSSEAPRPALVIDKARLCFSLGTSGVRCGGAPRHIEPLRLSLSSLHTPTRF